MSIHSDLAVSYSGDGRHWTTSDNDTLVFGADCGDTDGNGLVIPCDASDEAGRSAIVQLNEWRARDNSEPLVLRYPAKFMDGQTRWIEDRRIRRNADGLLSESGFLLPLCGLQQQSSAEVESNRLNSVLHSLPDLVFLQTLDGVYVDSTAAEGRRTVLPPEVFLGKRMQDILPKHMAESLNSAFENVVETRQPAVAEYCHLRDTGPEYFESRMMRCEPDLVLTVVRNITAAKRTSLVLALQNAILKKIAQRCHIEEILSTLILGIEKLCPTTQGSIVLLNTERTHVEEALAPSMSTEYTKMVIGLPIGPNMGSCGTACHRRELVIVEDMERDPLWSGHFENVRRFGLRACWSQPILDSDGVPLGSFAMYYPVCKGPQDWEIDLLREASSLGAVAITRDRADSELSALNAELEFRVRERTAELKLANDELESFSYSVAHDLRAPLRSIAGFSQILMDEYGGKFDPEVLEHLQRCGDSAKQMAVLVDALLELSRINRGTFQRVPVFIDEIAHRVITELRHQRIPASVVFQVQPDMSTEGDPSLLTIALDNLIGNAVKFTSQAAEPLVEIGSIAGKNEKVFFVKDNGIGFEQSYADNLFRPFETLHPNVSQKGDGIGLATVQRIVHRHGGRIWAESSAGEGATFYFTLKPALDSISVQ